MPQHSGRLIVITAPLTEIIDHAGYFIQMSMASLPMWLEGILNKKYPNWRHLEYNDDGSARYMPAGARVLEASLTRRYAAADVVCCYPDMELLVGLAAARTRGRLGIVVPRDDAWMRACFGLMNRFRGLGRRPLLAYVHRERDITAVAAAAGLMPASTHKGVLWHTLVYARP